METANHEYYVSLEVAKLLKDAGFDWEVQSYYSKLSRMQGKLLWLSCGCKYKENINTNQNHYSAPTLDVAQRWLREVKQLDISIHYDPTIKSQPYVYFIYDVEEKFNDILGIISPVTHSYSDGYFYTYEEAQNTGIKKALEIILEKEK